eukprot:6930765-Pyramimonas_sp.AAC.1
MPLTRGPGALAGWAEGQLRSAVVSSIIRSSHTAASSRNSPPSSTGARGDIPANSHHPTLVQHLGPPTLARAPLGKFS